MSENTVRIIGTKQNLLKRTLNFVFFCMKDNIAWTAETTLEDLAQAFKNASRTLFLIPNFVWVKLESFSSSYLTQIQDEINAFFYQLRYREDILCHPVFQELFSAPFFSLPLEFLSALKVSDTYTITSFKLITETKNIIAGFEYSSMFKGIGKIWSLIEAQNYGEIAVCGFDESAFLIECNDMKEQVRCCYWKKSSFEAVFGLDNGNLMIIKMKMKLGPNSKGIYDGEKMHFGTKSMFKVHGGPVIAIAGSDDLIITISTDSILKVSACKTQSGQNSLIETVSGGSLKQRLSSFSGQSGQKSRDKLVSLFFDTITKKVFLGSEQGQILVYLLENSIPKYQYTVACGESIKDLQVHLGSVYIAMGECIAIYSDCKNYEILARFRPHLEDSKITCLKYLQAKEKVFAGYSVNPI